MIHINVINVIKSNSLHTGEKFNWREPIFLLLSVEFIQ